MKRKEIRQRLDEAAVRETLVWITRRSDRRMWRGFVVGMGDGWVLLHTVPNATLRLNGYVALPVDAIGAVDEDNSFVPMALKLQGERPRTQPDLLLVDLPGLLSSAGTVFPLVAVFAEGDGRYCWIGRVAKLGRRKASLVTVGRDGAWGATRKVGYDKITRVDLGDGYLDALWLVAGRQRREAR